MTIPTIIVVTITAAIHAAAANPDDLKNSSENIREEIRYARSAVKELIENQLSESADKKIINIKKDLENLNRRLIYINSIYTTPRNLKYTNKTLFYDEIEKISRKMDRIVGRIKALEFVHGNPERFHKPNSRENYTELPKNGGRSNASMRGRAPDGNAPKLTCAGVSKINPQYSSLRPVCSGKVIRVGPGQSYQNPFNAIREAHEGDFVLIEGGTYSCHGSPFHHRNSNALIGKSVGIIGVGSVTFDVSYVHKGCITTRGRKNTPDWLYVENIRFTGARNGDFNGAGIRHVPGAGNLTIVGSHFEGNQNGVMGGGGPGTFVRVHDSTFIGNGHGDGRAHGIYMNGGDELVITDSTFKDQFVGHHIKSLATERTVVRNNVIDDAGGNASMNVDVTAGGDLIVEGNQIVQSANSDNRHIIWYHTKRGRDGADTKPGRIVIRDNKVTDNFVSTAILFGKPVDLPGVEVELTNNTITNESGKFRISDAPYTSTGNMLNGEPMPDGYVHPDWPVLEVSYPQYVLDAVGIDIPQPNPVRGWMTGAHRVAGWGKQTLEGTNQRDVMEARNKGTKTLKGLGGDDVYLPWGQTDIVEAEGEGHDWVLLNARTNAYYMPDQVEGLVMYADGSSTNIVGNDLGNVIIGGQDGGESLKGGGGDDIFYKPVVGGEVVGASGTDTLIMPCASTDAQWSDGGDWYPNVSCGGQANVTYRDIEHVVLSDKVMEPVYR